jgi:hypothetical protein
VAKNSLFFQPRIIQYNRKRIFRVCIVIQCIWHEIMKLSKLLLLLPLLNFELHSFYESRMFGRVSFGRVSFGRGSFSRMSFGREVIWSRGLMVIGSFGRMSFGRGSFACGSFGRDKWKINFDIPSKITQRLVDSILQLLR